jgi:hypothetical protein
MTDHIVERVDIYPDDTIDPSDTPEYALGSFATPGKNPLSHLSDRQLLEAIYNRQDDLVTAFESVGGIITKLTDDMQANGGGFTGLIKALMSAKKASD